MSSSNSDLVDFFTTKPTTFTWVIDDFVISSDQTSDDIDIRISKYQHELGKRENLAYQFILNYRLKLYLQPNRESDYMVIYFGIGYSPNANLSVQYRISLQNEKSEKCHTQEGKCHFIGISNQSNGIYRILRNYLLDKDNGLLPDGKLIVHVEMNVIDKSDFSTNVVTNEVFLQCHVIFSIPQNQLESLKCLTEQYIASTISIKSVSDIMKFAELYELEEMEIELRSFELIMWLIVRMKFSSVTSFWQLENKNSKRTS